MSDPNQKPKIKIRIKFSKHGVMRFIGHLDIMRLFQKAFRRAELDISYSGGFSPHQIMSFAAPLGVGLESDGEYLDVEMESVESSDDIVKRLDAQMPVGMHVHSAKLLPEKSKNAMASVAAAGYYLKFRDRFIPEEGWNSVIDNFLNQESILFTKTTKKNTLEIDLKPAIYILKQSSYRCEDCLYLMVNASSSGNIKPSMVMESIYRMLGLEFDEFNLLITREDTYLNIGTEDLPEFVPLDQIGEDVDQRLSRGSNI